jgi:hypothetical protein
MTDIEELLRRRAGDGSTLSHCYGCRGMLNEAAAEIRQLRAALAFYADPDILSDYGDVARKALGRTHGEQT